jgi:hypothetical protein
MIQTDSTALASPNANTSTPTRRSSWKSHSDIYTPVSNSEKPTTAAAPFRDSPSAPFHDNPTLSATPSDLESQSTHPYKPKSKRSNLGICVLVLLVLVFCIGGTVLLTHAWFPDVLGIEELNGELLDTDKAITMLKSQVNGLYRYVEGLDVLGSLKGYAGMGAGNGTERLGQGEVGGNETVMVL